MTLASSINDDRDQIVNDWGDTGIYNGGSTPVMGLFDNEYLSINLDGSDVQSAKSAFLCKTSDVPAAKKTDTMIVTSPLYGIVSVSYTVTSVEVNPADVGPGWTRLIFKKT